jgi:Spy/CpxP family protein refolding chaperone
MSLKNKILTAASLTLAVGAFSTFTSAQTGSDTTTDSNIQKQERRERRGFGKRGGFDKGMRGDKRGGGKFGMRGLRGIELTDAQKEQVRTIMESNRTANQATFEEFRTLRQAKRGGTLDATQQARLETLKVQMKQNAETTQAQVLAVLTPEQRTRLEQRKQEMQEKREQRRQMRRDRQTPTTSTQEG